MSQKGEKYARRMERRVDKLEQDVAAITTEQTTQGVRISAVEDDLAVYRAAVSARELKQAAAQVEAAKERRTARAAERERKARRRNKVLAFIALALFVAVCVVMVAKAYSEEPAAEPTAPEASAAPAAILPTELLFTAAAEEEYMEDPQEAEKIEEALLAQGYFSLAVPMPYEWQDYMRTYCEEYGCPYLVMYQNPQGCFTAPSGKTVPPKEAMDKLDRMAQSLGELIDREDTLLRNILESDRKRK